MARSMNKPGYPSYLPRNWRVITVAGVTTLGLACGLADSARGQWWQLSRPSTSAQAATTTKPTPTENGFTATIRRLLSDSRRAADQGDLAKAVQLAERAAKISEASAQLLGPTSECSPQETARFLADMRAKRDGLATASRTSPSATPVRAQTASKPRTIASAQSKSVDKAVVPATPAAGRGLFGSGELPGSPSAPIVQSRSRVVQQPQKRMDPSPAHGTPVAEELLAQSRSAASAGNRSQAIELAEQAVQRSQMPALFGPIQSGSSNEATRWLDHLLAQQSVQTQSDHDLQPLVDESGVQEPSAGPGNQLASSSSVTEAELNQESALIARSDTLWSDDLPPAPAPQPRNPSEPMKFSRSELSRSSGWVNADSVDGQETVDSPVSVEPGIGVESAEAEQSRSAIPEFPISGQTEPVPEESVTPIGVTESHEVPTTVLDLSPDEDVEAASVPEVIEAANKATEIVPVTSVVPAGGRVPLRVRGTIQQTSGEVSAASNEPRQPQSKSGWAKVENEASGTVESVDEPVQRFPIQKVLRLRRRLESAAALNPGGWNSSTPESDTEHFTPTTSAAPGPKSAPVQANSPTTTVSVVQPAEPEHRPGVKLRTRSRLKIEDELGTTLQASTAVPKMSVPNRKPVVAHSVVTRWKSLEPRPEASEAVAVNESNPGSSQPTLAAPISQAGFETTSVSDDNPTMDSSIGLMAPGMNANSMADDLIGAPPPPATPEETPWYHDAASRARKSGGSSTVIHKTSFGLIDQLAGTFHLPVATMMSLIGFGGMALFGVGLIAIRAAMRRRHSS
ncbi:MAG: hypothetical protein JSS49_25605 [Planctomycetes bacterium]|nr:hypothetical protein [Planctomycetota bacterium]